MVDVFTLQAIDLQDVSLVRSMMQRHVKHTGSPRAKALLADWPSAQSHFVKVFPHEFRRAMAEAKKAKVSMSIIAFVATLLTVGTE